MRREKKLSGIFRWGREMIQAYGLVDLLDQDALDTLEIPVTVDIYKKKSCRQGSSWI